MSGPGNFPGPDLSKGLVPIFWRETYQFDLSVYGDGLCIEDDVYPQSITVQETDTDP